MGKDFIADNFYSDYFRISFADHFKCDTVGKQIYTYNQVYVTKEPEVRHGLQRIGTEEGRDVYGLDVWLNCAESWMYTFFLRNHISKFCIADVRFDNEAQWIKDFGGYVIKIESDRTLITMDEEANAHSSESGISENLIDYIVNNDKKSTMDDLRLQFDFIDR